MFIRNQKVRVRKDTKNDGTCSSCRTGCVIAKAGEEGFVRRVGEFMGEAVVEVHFFVNNRLVGFREKELELVEDFNPDTGEWVPVPCAAAHG